MDDALLGLLACSDAALEVLAIDDGSTDSGAERVRAWARRDPRVRCVHTEGVGLVQALSRGLALARGELIARMDGDDLCHPRRLATQRAFLAQQATVSVLGTQVAAQACEGELGEGLLRYVAWQNDLLSPEDHRRELFVESPLCHPSVMIRRSALTAVSGYRATQGPEDYDLWLRLDAAGFAMAKVPQVLLTWRHRKGRATFVDPRYGLERFRAAKAPFLATRLLACRKTQRVMWGAGPTGRRLARALEAHGVRFDCFIDIDPRKLGRVARGAPIVPPSELCADRDAVVAAVGARGARERIRSDLAARGFVEGEDCWFAA